MGKATLGFAGGPAIAFRIDPDNIIWDFEIITNVIDTIGGRVIQVIGSYLNDLTVTGSFGMDHSTPQGQSWRQAEAFLALIQSIMNYQSSDANKQAMMHPPAIFTYPPKNWRFNVYVKAFDDADNPGTSVVLTPGKFNNRWRLALFIVQDSSTALVTAGDSHGVVNKQAEAAIAAYMARISQGVGWHFSQYTGAFSASDQASQEGIAKQIYPDMAAHWDSFNVSVGGYGAATGSGGGNLSVSASADLTAWIKALLAGLGDPETPANLNSMIHWQALEEPPSQWNKWNNPFNSTEPMPGATTVNSAGVKHYQTLSDGLNATVKTLNNGNYPNILKLLKEGKGLKTGAEHDLYVWSGGGYTSV